MPIQRIMYEVNHSITIALLLLLTLTMLGRQLHRRAPVFFAYIAFDTVGMAIAYVLFHFGSPYSAYYSSWAEHAVCVLLGFAVIAEIFNKLFASYDGIRKLANIAMLWSTVLLVVVAVVSSLFHRVADSVPILTIFLMLDRSLMLIQLGLVLSLFALTRYLHLRWKNLTFGVALGFGFDALTLLAVNIVRVHYGQFTGITALQDSGYCIAVLIWVAYVLQPEAARIPIVSLPSHELENWDRILTRLLGDRSTPAAPTE